MARNITMATGKVAFTVSFPVEVLIKSDPKTEAKKNPRLIKNLLLHLSHWKKWIACNAASPPPHRISPGTTRLYFLVIMWKNSNENLPLKDFCF